MGPSFSNIKVCNFKHRSYSLLQDRGYLEVHSLVLYEKSLQRWQEWFTNRMNFPNFQVGVREEIRWKILWNALFPRSHEERRWYHT